MISVTTLASRVPHTYGLLAHVATQPREKAFIRIASSPANAHGALGLNSVRNKVGSKGKTSRRRGQVKCSLSREEEDEVVEVMAQLKGAWGGSAETDSNESPSSAATMSLLRNFEEFLEAPASPSSPSSPENIPGTENAAVCLRVVPCPRSAMEQTVDILSESFSDMAGPLTIRGLLRLQVKVYLAQRLLSLPHGITLVAQKLPRVAGLLEKSVNKVEQHQEKRAREEAGEVVATVELSFSEKARPKFVTLNPPAEEGAAYLCNMAVGKAHRGKGIGKALLSSAESLCTQLGMHTVHLHCRLSDEVPFGLYSQAGYEVVGEDAWWAPIRTWEGRRRLMRKHLSPVRSI